MKAILACDVDFSKVKWPVMVMPKIDGVRGLNPDSVLVGRSGKRYASILNTEKFSGTQYIGFDGELVAGAAVGALLCSETTSAMTTIHGTVPVKWCLFDCFEGEGITASTPYIERYRLLELRINTLFTLAPELQDELWLVPFSMASNEKEVRDLEIKYLELGYEGLILRDPNGLYKNGRTTAKEANYLRLKPFKDAEILITHITEGRTNENEATLSPNGYSERSTHSENMIPNGMVGNLIGTALQDEFFNNVKVIAKGQVICIGAGKLSHEERKFYFDYPDEIIGKIAKYQYFPIGIKDKPRFPTFQSIRSPIDMN